MSRELLTAALCTIAALAPLTARAEDNRAYASAMLQYVMFDDAKPQMTMVAAPAPVAAVAAVPVVAAVVVPDSDGDGVSDTADRCPGTPAGTAVLAGGCPVPKVVKLEGVTFTSGTAKLDLAVQALKDNPTIAVEVAGHTDASGDAEANRALSQRRADAVRKYLLDGGVAADQVSARGYGEDEPTASNDTAEGRALNRRVELRTKQ